MTEVSNRHFGKWRRRGARVLIAGWAILFVLVSFFPNWLKTLLGSVGPLHHPIHISVFFLAGLLLLTTVSTFSGRISGFAAIFLIATAVELAQSAYYTISFEWQDVMSDCIGLMLAGLVYAVISFWKNRYRRRDEQIRNQHMRYSRVIALLLAAGMSAALANADEPPADPCAISPDYVLGGGDQLTILVVHLESDFTDRTFAITGTGDLTVPHVGAIRAAGLTVSGLEAALRSRLSPILKDPQVAVGISGYRSQPISVLGALNNPGMRQIDAGRSLFDALSLAGGLRSDAGFLIHITRSAKCGPIPLPAARTDASGKSSSAAVRVKDILSGEHPELNIPIYPGDQISVPKAEVVYAVGSVHKPGGFLLNEHESLSALQVLSLSEGPQRTADLRRAKILRPVSGSTARTEITVDLKDLMSGKGNDIPLAAGDILFIPNSGKKSAGYRTLDAATGLAGAALIYAR